MPPQNCKIISFYCAGIAASASILFCAALAYAQAESAPSADAADPPKVRISKKDCQRLVRHVASADVAYTPGVDVRGNAVVPADAAGAFTVPIPDVFEFAITKDLTAYLGGAEEQLAADKAAAIAAEKSVAATEAAVSSAALSLAGAEDILEAANAASEAAATAAAAAPNDAGLAAAATTAAAAAESAQTGYDAVAASYATTAAAAKADNVAEALTAAQATQSIAETELSYAPNDTATQAASDASRLASESTAADTEALSAAETVAKSADMTLNVGTVRYNIDTGAMTFNGQPINDAASSDLAVRCRQMMPAK